MYIKNFDVYRKSIYMYISYSAIVRTFVVDFITKNTCTYEKNSI